MQVAGESLNIGNVPGALRPGQGCANLARNMLKMIVREVAERAGITNPYQLAEAAQLPYETCRLIWTGKSTRIDLRTIERLCTVLGVVPGQLFDFKPEEMPSSSKPEQAGKRKG